jgi:hypothetical protein
LEAAAVLPAELPEPGEHFFLQGVPFLDQVTEGRGDENAEGPSASQHNPLSLNAGLRET